MKEVRDLLMDIRIELRQHVRDFHKTDLCKRIDDTRDALLHGPQAVAAAAAAVSHVEGADRVAQAWKDAAEDIKLTAPAIYELLSRKAAARIAAMPPLKPSTPVPAQAESSGATAGAATTPTPAAAAASPAAAAPVQEDTGPAPSLMMVAVEAHIPNAEMLGAIAASKRRFTEAQREWCVGEAMVRSGFSIDPEEFIARGDNEMARYILETVEDA
jgi:hypothetical protein